MRSVWRTFALIGGIGKVPRCNLTSTFLSLGMDRGWPVRTSSEDVREKAVYLVAQVSSWYDSVKMKQHVFLVGEYSFWTST